MQDEPIPLAPFWPGQNYIHAAMVPAQYDPLLEGINAMRQTTATLLSMREGDRGRLVDAHTLLDEIHKVNTGMGLYARGLVTYGDQLAHFLGRPKPKGPGQ
jgi:hypothetical protein